jgi:hypothetical protein
MLSFQDRRTPGRMRAAYLLGGIAVLSLLACANVRATPAFARQTGSPCADCHAGAYGPALTPFGIRFKLNGYTDSDGKGFKLPLAAQLIASYSDPARGKSNTQLTEADIFLAGRLSDQIGGFVKLETDNDGHDRFNTRLSNLDLRFVAKELKAGDKDLTLGVSVNNNPGYQDPIAALPGATMLGPPGVTGTVLNPSSPNAPANRAIGATVYGLYDSRWYGEVGTYRSLQRSTQDDLGYNPNGDPGKLSDTGYFRFAYMRDMRRQFFSAGVVALTTKRQLPRGAPRDDLTDLGYDLSYQFIGNREHIVQLSYVNILERRRYGSTPPSPIMPGLFAKRRGIVHDQVFTAAYTFKQTYTLLFSHLVDTGSRDEARFIPYGVPDTTANLISLYWAPFGKEDSFTSIANLKIAATWFRFRRFNGSRTNIFGVPGTNAGDLNAFSLSASVAF